MKSIRTLLVLFAAIAMPAIFIAEPAAGQFYAGSRLLLNYFEVDLESAEITTLFAITNTAPEPIEVRASIYSNWGIHILDTEFELDGHQVLTVDLRNWLAAGNLPDRELGIDELEHVQTSLSGRRSPMTDMFYSKELFLYQAVGYIIFEAIGGDAEPDTLIGDFFNLAPGQDYAQGQALLNIDPAAPCEKICFRHGLRFLSGGFDAGTEIFVWTRRQGSPSADGYFPDHDRVQAEVLVYEESGQLIDTLALELLPLELIKVGDFGLPAAFGWFDITTEDESFIAVRYGALGRFSVGLKTFCLPLIEDPGPGIRLEKKTNGYDADFAPGPEIEVGALVTWTYEVTNTGGVTLSDVVVSDSQGVEVSCPYDTLEPGESMTCTGSGYAEPCQYENLGIATGIAADGSVVDDDDPSHYYGLAEIDASIDIEKHTNGVDADTPDTAPAAAAGTTVVWEYIVTNTGSVTLENVAVDDDIEGPVTTCPTTTLQPGQSMTCTSTGIAGADPGQIYSNLGTVTATGTGECGTVEVTDSDRSHYIGGPVGECFPTIDIEKHTNGFDADVAPGPEIAAGAPVLWEYIVTNTGGLFLDNVQVTDDRGVAVSCPQNTLAADEWMTCTGNGFAVAGPYWNLGTVVAAVNEPTCPPSTPETVTDSDPSHYYGVCGGSPAIAIEKATNGFDADTGVGPEIAVGAQVTWTYVVTNTGDIALGGIEVDDDREGTVSCPQSSLEPGQSMTCILTGIAVEGEYSNLGSVTASASGGPGCPVQEVADSDPSHYHTPPPSGGEGCTPGYWKQPHHFDSWQGFDPDDLFSDVFGVGPAVTLLDAVSEGGGGYDALGRHAVAGLLNANHSGVDYLFDLSTVIGLVQGAYDDGDPESTKDDLAEQNEQGCPLN